MQVAKHKVVAFDYTLQDEDGETIDTSQGSDPLSYLHGADNIVPGLERELEGKVIGDQFKVAVQPEDGYGTRRDELRQVVAIENFSEVDDLQVGMQFRMPTDDEDFVVITVVEITDDKVTVDGNHALAGVVLHFDVTIRDIREASEEEIEHGHVHGPDGHTH